MKNMQNGVVFVSKRSSDSKQLLADKLCYELCYKTAVNTCRQLTVWQKSICWVLGVVGSKVLIFVEA